MIIWIIMASIGVGFILHGMTEKYPFARANRKQMIAILNKIARGGN